MAACNPATGPGLMLVSPAAPAAGAGAGESTTTTTTASAWGGETGCWAGGGGKRGAAPRALGGGGSALAPSELFLSQVQRDERNASVVISAPQAFAAHASPVTVAVFSAAGDRLVTCDGTGVVLLWSNLAAPAPEAWDAPPLPLPRRSGGEACGPAGRSGGGGLFGGGDGVEVEEVEAGAAEGARVIVDEEEREEEGLALRVRVPGEGDMGQEEEGFAKTAPMPVAAAASSADLVTPMGQGPRAGGTGGPGRYASMLDQTPSPTAVQNPSRSSNATAVEAAAEDRGSERAGSGPLAEAIQALQTVVDDAAAAVGEGDDGGGMISGAVRPPMPPAMVEVKRHRFGGTEEEVVARVVEDGDGGRPSDSGGIEAKDSADGDEVVASRGGGGRRAAPIPAAEIRPISGRASLVAERTGTAMSPVTWHPASARLFYTEGSSLYAEDLESCRRWALLSASVPPASCVAVSADGRLVARGASSQRPVGSGSGSGSGVSSSCLSVWRLGYDSMPPKPRDGDAGDAKRSKATSSSATANSVDACEEVGAVGSSGGGGVAALAFSPCGADLWSLGEWDGTKCLLEVRPTSAFVAAASADNSGSAASSSSLQSAASNVVVTPLSTKTSAICALPPGKTAAEGRQGVGAAAAATAAAAGEPEPYLFATGGEEGVCLWRRVFDQARQRGTALRARGGEDGDGGGLKLLGTSAGRGRVTSLVSAGRFVVAADVPSCPPPSSSSGGGGGGGGGGDAAAAPFVTAIDVNWLAAGGQEGESAIWWVAVTEPRTMMVVSCLTPRALASEAIQTAVCFLGAWGSFG